LHQKSELHTLECNNEFLNAKGSKLKYESRDTNPIHFDGSAMMLEPADDSATVAALMIQMNAFLDQKTVEQLTGLSHMELYRHCHVWTARKGQEQSD
jgi:hypothetical protein